MTEESSETIADLLHAGAERVLSRPFTVEAFDAHVDALRRSGAEERAGTHRSPYYAYQDLRLDFATSTLTLAGERVPLSPLQYRLVDFLAHNAGAVATLSQISNAVWGPGYDASSELVRSHVRNIRRLLGDPASDPRYLKTEPQIGYWMPREDRAFPGSLLQSPAFLEVLDATLDLCISIAQADMGNIQLLDEACRALIIVCQRGFRDEFLDHFRRVSVGDGSACSVALERGQCVVIEDITKDPLYLPHVAVALRAGYRAVRSIPVRSRHGTIGVISTHFREPHVPDSAQLRLLELAARIFASFLEQSMQLMHRPPAGNDRAYNALAAIRNEL